MTEPAPANPTRFCPVCKVADDHPRHDIFGTDPNVAPHMDCCAASGCPDGSCDVNVWIAASADQPKGAAGKVGYFPTGDSFRNFLTDVNNRDVLAPLLAPDSEYLKQFTHADIDQGVHGVIMQAYVTLQPVTGGSQ